MLGRFARDESGITMGLVVIMIVLIGVMGAGLLTFVQRDLESVVEVNQGQKAFELADAGVQAGKRQLLVDAFRQHYDTTHTNDCANGNIRTGSDWSPTTTGFPNANCTGTAATKQAGVTRPFAGGQFNVTIQCINQTGDPLEGSSTDTCIGGGSTFPESVPADAKSFFKRLV